MTGQDLLDMGLYEASYRHSRMKKVLEGDADRDIRQSQHMYQLARVGGSIVGLAVMEKIPKTEHRLMLLKNPFLNNSAIESEFRKKFVCDGFFQVYVKPEFRGRGIAKKLAKRIISKYQKSRDPADKSIPMFVARDAAKEILRKVSPEVGFKHDFVSYNSLRGDIHFSTARCIDLMNLKPDRIPEGKGHHEIRASRP